MVNDYDKDGLIRQIAWDKMNGHLHLGQFTEALAECDAMGDITHRTKSNKNSMYSYWMVQINLCRAEILVRQDKLLNS